VSVDFEFRVIRAAPPLISAPGRSATGRGNVHASEPGQQPLGALGTLPRGRVDGSADQTLLSRLLEGNGVAQPASLRPADDDQPAGDGRYDRKLDHKVRRLTRALDKKSTVGDFVAGLVEAIGHALSGM
jgi:hypothetical protein